MTDAKLLEIINDMSLEELQKSNPFLVAAAKKINEKLKKEKK